MAIGAFRVVLETNSSMELAKEFIRGSSLGGGIGGLLYTRNADGSLGYFHYDGQGNVVSVTDQAREELAYYEYDAWGNVLTACGEYANEFAFSTKQASKGTGLIDFGYCHYDPQTGRWTQRDPIGLAGGRNLYGYCRNDPVNLVDTNGRKPTLQQLDDGNWVYGEPGFEVNNLWDAIDPETQQAIEELAQEAEPDVQPANTCQIRSMDWWTRTYLMANTIELVAAASSGDETRIAKALYNIASTFAEYGYCGKTAAVVFGKLNVAMLLIETPKNLTTIVHFIMELTGLVVDICSMDFDAMFPTMNNYNEMRLGQDVNRALDDIASRAHKKRGGTNDDCITAGDLHF